MFNRMVRDLTGSWRSKLAGLAVLCALAMITTIVGRAQLSTATLNGSVTDNTGALVQGAKVVVVQTETNFTTETVSGQDGLFRVSSLPVGPYVIRVSKDGFSKYEQG